MSNILRICLARGLSLIFIMSAAVSASAVMRPGWDDGEYPANHLEPKLRALVIPPTVPLDERQAEILQLIEGVTVPALPEGMGRNQGQNLKSSRLSVELLNRAVDFVLGQYPRGIVIPLREAYFYGSNVVWESQRVMGGAVLSDLGGFEIGRDSFKIYLHEKLKQAPVLRRLFKLIYVVQLAQIYEHMEDKGVESYVKVYPLMDLVNQWSSLTLYQSLLAPLPYDVLRKEVLAMELPDRTKLPLLSLIKLSRESSEGSTEFIDTWLRQGPYPASEFKSGDFQKAILRALNGKYLASLELFANHPEVVRGAQEQVIEENLRHSEATGKTSVFTLVRKASEAGDELTGKIGRKLLKSGGLTSCGGTLSK